MRHCALLLLASCASPVAGDPCSSIEDSFCAPNDRVTLYACLSGAYEAIDCRVVCAHESQSFAACAPSESGSNDVCLCRPCAGNSPIFTGFIGYPCRPPDDPTPMCRGDVQVSCDITTCQWVGVQCPEDPDCNAYCTEDGECAQFCF